MAIDVVAKITHSRSERALQVHCTTGLDAEQFDELVTHVESALEFEWDRGVGRRRKLTLAEAVAVTCAYSRQNIVEEVLAEWWDVSQPVISRVITLLTPVVEKVLASFIPTESDAVEAVTGRVCLLDGSLSPCWSWDEHRELWIRKHGTTGFNFQVITDLAGNILYISDPVSGSIHDSRAITMTPVASILDHSGGVITDKGYQCCGYVTPRKKPKGGELSVGDKETNKYISRLRAPVERAMAHIKSWRTLHTDYRRPYRTYTTSFRAAIGLFFFKASFE